MSKFLYYLPGVASNAEIPQAVRECGLAYAFGKQTPNGRGCSNGPDGSNGVVVAAGDGELGYYKDRQTWRTIPGSRAWLGWRTGELPQADDLLRPDALGGHAVQLADGAEWLAPIARGWAVHETNPIWFVALPQRSVLSDNGQWEVGGVLPKYERLFELAERVWIFWTSARVESPAGADVGKVAFDFDGLHESAIEALQANYKIGPAECDALGLLTKQHCLNVLLALVDWPHVVEWMKDNETAALGNEQQQPPAPPAAPAIEAASLFAKETSAKQTSAGETSLQEEAFHAVD